MESYELSSSFLFTCCRITKTGGTADKYARHTPGNRATRNPLPPLKNLNRTRVRMKCRAGYKENRLSELSCEDQTDFEMRKNLEIRG